MKNIYKMYIHKEGKNWVLGILLVYVGLILCLSWYGTIFTIPVALIFGVLFLLILNFFRNPERIVYNKDDQQILCPADGKVVVIEKVFEGEYFKDERLQISVFMNPLNVHVNRYPIGGIIQFSKYHAGKYLVAWHPKSSTENERTTVVIKRNDGKEVMIRQIAGAVARRICNYAVVAQTVNQGDEQGFIKFGSRVDVYLPLDAVVNVELEQVVKGNIDVLAKLY